ncbi:hypothetical protein EV421DRAFT_1275263 [Armillaria borealis]|uniref:Uncharacterized protein n=1 Tax=Armillaria borealis TaxID=47425 RepID=A0AA39MIB6_9AGAR|nr:hypothetical protein EV421DRAFT_1275263 [Armillaria borealis]
MYPTRISLICTNVVQFLPLLSPRICLWCSGLVNCGCGRPSSRRCVQYQRDLDFGRSRYQPRQPLFPSNPLIVEITLDRVAVSAGINSTEYISFDHTFEDSVVVPALGTANSGVIENVALTQGGLTTLNIVPDGFLDLLNLDLFLREGTIGGVGGIPVTDTGLTKADVPTTWDTPFN